MLKKRKGGAAKKPDADNLTGPTAAQEPTKKKRKKGASSSSDKKKDNDKKKKRNAARWVPNAYKIFVADFHASRRRSEGAAGEYANAEPGASMKAAAAAWKNLSAEERGIYERKKVEEMMRRGYVFDEEGNVIARADDG